MPEPIVSIREAEIGFERGVTMNACSSNYEIRNMGRVGWFCNRTACVSQAKKLVGRIFLGFFPSQEKTNNVFAEKRAEGMPHNRVTRREP